MYTIVVCVLNEQENIVELITNLKQSNPAEIIIVDGGSIDKTTTLISRYPDVKLLTMKARGLLAQRLLGIQASKTESVVLINADDRFKDGEIDMLYHEFVGGEVDGLQMSMAVYEPKTYCQKAWDVYFKILGSPGDHVPLLGRPYITKKQYFDGINESRIIFNEDTYLMQEQKILYGELKYFVSKAECHRKCLSSWEQNIKQFTRYGISDVDVANKYNNHLQLIYHHLIRISIIRSLDSVISGKGKYAPFIFVMGLVRLYSFLTKLISINNRTIRS